MKGFQGIARAAPVIALVWASPVLADFGFSFRTPGAGDSLRDALLATSLVYQAKSEGNDDPQDLLAAAQADYSRLVGVLYDRARYGGVISILVNGQEAASISPLDPPDDVRDIRIQVDPGPAFVFGATQVGPLAQGTTLPDGFRRNGLAAAGVIRDTSQAAVDGWRNIGHAKANISSQKIVARHDDSRLDVSLAVSPGPALTFGTISVEGNDRTRTARILKIAGLEEGRVYDPTEIERAVRRLRRTGSFGSVTVEEAEDIAPGDTLPLTIGVIEATPRRFGFGAEYSTVDGLRLSGFWLHRNFLGGAERFRVDGEIAGITGETGGTDYTFGVRYERPATPKADIDFFAEYQFEALDEPEFTSDSSEFTLGFTRYATEELTVEAGLGYLYADITDEFGHENFSMINLPLAAEYDRRDDTLNPRDGYYADLTITPFLGLSGTSDGAQATLDARGYHSFSTLTLAGRLQWGSLFGPSLEESPATYRFYSGGGGTVRGQDYQSLGVDIGTVSTGGRSFVGLSAEARVDVNETIQIVPFVDWGYIGEESFPDFSGNSHSGAGLGLRYNTGIGPIRLDVATPLSGEAEASNFYIYVGIGQAF